MIEEDDIMFWLKWAIGLSAAIGVYGLLRFYDDPAGGPIALTALCACVVFIAAYVAKRKSEKRRRAENPAVQTPRHVFTPTVEPPAKSPSGDDA